MEIQGLAAERHALKLSFVAGFVDTVGFIALFGLFTAHVTGNFVLIGAALLTGGAGLIAKLLALPMFVVAVAATTAFVRSRERAGRLALPAVLLGEIVFLLAFLAFGVLAGPFEQADTLGGTLAGLMGVSAMGIQNAAARLVYTQLAPTTVMTGNVTQVVVDLVDLRTAGRDRPDAQGSAALKARIGRLWPPVLAFAVGAIGGALAFGGLGFASLAIPVAALCWLYLGSRGRLGSSAARG